METIVWGRHIQQQTHAETSPMCKIIIRVEWRKIDTYKLLKPIMWRQDIKDNIDGVV